MNASKPVRPVRMDERHTVGCGLRPVRILAALEANSVTGPAKAFIEFCRALQSSAGSMDYPAVEASVVTFQRSGDELRHQASRSALERAMDDTAIRHSSIPERFRFDARAISALDAVTREFQADIVESHSIKSHALVWASGIWRRIPWLAYHHGYTSSDMKMSIYNCFDALTLRAADRVITVAEAFVPILIRRGVQRERLRVVHNALTPGAGTWRKQAARQTLGLPDSIPVVLSLGRLSREKGVEHLLRAFALMERGQESLLVIAGEGPEKQRLEQIAQVLGVSIRTRFVGHILDPSPYFAAADVFAMPSLSEGSPYTLLEALAAGTPVVATRAGGIPEMVSHGITALTVPPGDSAAMADAISRLLADRTLRERLVSNGRNDVVRRFGAAMRAWRLLHLHAEVLEERRSSMEKSR